MKNKMNIIFHCSIVLFFLTSCVENVEVDQVIKGMWSIDRNEIIYKGGVDITFCLKSNVIVFDNKCRLPTTIESCSVIPDSGPVSGSYELNSHESGFTIEFDTKNNLFSNQIFEVYFDKDEEEKLLKMILVSENLWLKCTKGLFYYDSEKVNELIRLTTPR